MFLTKTIDLGLTQLNHTPTRENSVLDLLSVVAGLGEYLVGEDDGDARGGVCGLAGEAPLA